MRKLSVLFIVFFSASHTIHAEEVIYCPSVVECTNENRATCKVKNTTKDIEPHPEYWKINGGGCGGECLIKGEYKFYYAKAYNFKKKKTSVSCFYSKKSPYGSQNLQLQISDELKGTFFEPFLKKSDILWDIKDNEGTCNSNYPNLCPFMDIPYLVYSYNKSENIRHHVIIRVKNAPYNEIGEFYGDLKLIDYNTLLEFCGSVSQCDLEIESYSVPNDTYFIAGNVIVDLTTTNVIKVVSYSRGNNSLCTLQKRKEQFSTIYCKE